MKRYLTAVGFLLILGLLSCEGVPQPVAPSTTPDTSASIAENSTPRPSPASDEGTEISEFPIEVGVFESINALFDAGGGGCGMSLSKTGTSPQANKTLFFHGIPENPALMIFDGQVRRLSRTAASGEEFYGQQTSQTFMTEDDAVVVQVNVALGAEGEIESVNLPEGLLTIETQGQKLNIPVVGDAGC